MNQVGTTATEKGAGFRSRSRRTIEVMALALSGFDVAAEESIVYRSLINTWEAAQSCGDHRGELRAWEASG